MSAFYLAQIDCKAGGCFRLSTASLDDIRAWALAVGNKGETLAIVRSGQAMSTARVIII